MFFKFRRKQTDDLKYGDKLVKRNIKVHKYQ